MWNHGWYGYGWGWGPMMALNGLISLAVTIFVIVLILRFLRSGSHPLHPFRRPGLDILEERYARGEIDREEYLQKKQDLGG